MRITGGEFQGRHIRPPRSRAVRPTMDRMRESLFASLGDLEGCRFLDLFSGTGVVAAEALSRGAESVVAVERDRANRELIAHNTEFAQARIAIRLQPSEAFLRRARAGTTWHYIFADPPFVYAHLPELLASVVDGDLLEPSGRLLVHLPTHRSVEAIAQSALPLVMSDRRRYGGSTLYQFGEPNR